jgi:hypothetical protein
MAKRRKRNPGAVLLVPPFYPTNERNTMLSVYDLNAQELAFWFGLTIDGKKVDLIARMRPYDENEAINLERDKGVLLKDSKEEEGYDVEMKTIAADKEFFDKHKIAVLNNGKEISDDTLKMLDARISPPFSSIVINRGYRPTVGEVQDFNDPDEYSLDAMLNKDIEVTTFHTVYDQAAKKEVELSLIHVFRPPHAGDAMRWDQRQKTRTLTRGRVRGIIDHYVIKDSYNAMIKSVAGYTMGPVSCEASNKETWLAQIPYWHKMTAVSQVFAVSRKNA